MKVQFFDPYPPVLGPDRPIPAELAKVAEEFAGQVIPFAAGAARIQDACPEGTVWTYEGGIYVGLGGVRLPDGRTIPKDTWLVIRFREMLAERLVHELQPTEHEGVTLA